MSRKYEKPLALNLGESLINAQGATCIGGSSPGPAIESCGGGGNHRSLSCVQGNSPTPGSCGGGGNAYAGACGGGGNQRPWP